ncbi:hypothetical protein EV426DRAFT_577172 [Tirmania nivea]|nr:hypothetical protein EV426DRAFT_577172 [Tirmania nivea]
MECKFESQVTGSLVAQSLVEKLLAHLRSSSVTSFADACEELNVILEEIEKFKGQNYRSSRLTLRNLNYDLDKLVNGTRQASTSVKRTAGKLNVVEHYKRVRWHAIVRSLLTQRTVYALQGANMQLEMRSVVDPKTKDSDFQMTRSSSGFNLIIPVTKQRTAPHRWRELELEHLPTESLSSTSNISCVSRDCIQALPGTKAQVHSAQNSNGRVLGIHIDAEDTVLIRNLPAHHHFHPPPPHQTQEVVASWVLYSWRSRVFGLLFAHWVQHEVPK